MPEPKPPEGDEPLDREPDEPDGDDQQAAVLPDEDEGGE